MTLTQLPTNHTELSGSRTFVWFSDDETLAVHTDQISSIIYLAPYTTGYRWHQLAIDDGIMTNGVLKEDDTGRLKGDRVTLKINTYSNAKDIFPQMEAPASRQAPYGQASLDMREDGTLTVTAVISERDLRAANPELWKATIGMESSPYDRNIQVSYTFPTQSSTN